MPHDDFDPARRERAKDAASERYSFTVGGELFECLPFWPVGGLIDLAEAGLHASSYRAFIANALSDDDVARFDALLRRKVDPIDGSSLADIANRMIDVLTGRPPTKLSDSPTGSESTEESSEAVSSSAATPSTP